MILLLNQGSINLIKIALARAGIQLESSLFRMTTSLMRENVLLGLNNSSLTSFARSSFYACQLTQRQLEQRIQPQVKKLFKLIINGEFDEVKKILNIDPYLSLKKWKTNEEKEQVIINKAGQHIYIQGKTGLQLALGEEDTEITQIFKAAILKIADEQEVAKQSNIQFPNNWE
jgi:hypothetical protein